MINSLSNIPIQTKAYQHKNNNLPIKNVAGFDEFVLQDKIPVTYKGGRAFLETNIQQILDKNTKEVVSESNKAWGEYIISDDDKFGRGNLIKPGIYSIEVSKE